MRARSCCVAEAARAAGIGHDGAAMGGPACAMIPQAMSAARGNTSLGCIGNRVYTGLGDAELYFTIPGARLPDVVAKLETVVHANPRAASARTTRAVGATLRLRHDQDPWTRPSPASSSPTSPRTSPGPYCTQILGDMGAQVVKVERPGRGDDARAWAPPYWGQESATFMSVNRNKRSLAVDMKAPEGRAILGAAGRARRRARAVAAGRRRRGAGARLGRRRAGSTRASSTARSPRSAPDGPLKDRPGYDPLMQAYGGIMSVNGHRGQPPARVAMSIIDMGTGMWAVTAILAALRERDRTGRGAHVTTALFDTAIAAVAIQMGSYLATGEVPEPQGSGTQMIAPYEAFPTRDAWVMIGAASDALFAKTCEALGLRRAAGRPALRVEPARASPTALRSSRRSPR